MLHTLGLPGWSLRSRKVDRSGLSSTKVDVVLHEDVTARHRAEQALHESEEKFRLMADTIPQLAWMAGPTGDAIWYNRRWYEYTGTTPQEMQAGGGRP